MRQTLISHSVVVKNWASNQQSQLLGFLGTGPRTIKGRPAQTNRDEGPGRGLSKPLRRDDQTKAMTVDKRAQRRGFWWRWSLEMRIDQASTFYLAQGEEETALWLWASSYDTSDGGSGELSGDTWRCSMDSFYSVKGFGDEQPLGEIKGDQFCEGARGDVLALVDGEITPHQIRH
ncbi:hypothetical protein Acr_29g0005120 [Actinidia rufa]|uniref:Uncharacterized protein n=1 Tax=Actinidia rufa TaxID=165716 RepID=A0A7J0HDZ1_9ERIC|nr:hypothetical protein Acr_29g0005120 [Actinidia rufa]